MKILKFGSSRRFSVVSYSVGHGFLLLRSGKTNSYPTRIDILIGDVRAMEIRMWFDGIRIEEEDIEYLDGYSSKPSEMLEYGNKIYAIHGAGWSGFVVGGAFTTVEDDKDFMAPSALLPNLS